MERKASDPHPPGVEFLWLLLTHFLPRRFRRVRDFGLLHANAKRLIQLLQLVFADSSVPTQPPSRSAHLFALIAADR
jgi:hypothetical protein